jgi:5-formyltetrahydrofolate cyclo-ligase
MLKEELRKKYRTMRSELSAKEIEFKSFQIAQKLLQMKVWNWTYYHLFLSINTLKEVNTEPLGKNKEVVLPKSNFQTLEMSHLLMTENTRIQKNRYNIPEPCDGIEVPLEKIEVVFVPLMAFDQKGQRVGYGKGFYDRFLQKSNALKIGLSFFEAETEICGTTPNDVPLDFCVTPLKSYEF